MGDMVPPAKITARDSVTISRKWVDGSRRRNFSVMASGCEGSSDLEKKRRPSLDGCVRAERREEIGWRAGVDDSDFDGGKFLDLADDCVAVVVSV